MTGGRLLFVHGADRDDVGKSDPDFVRTIRLDNRAERPN